MPVTKVTGISISVILLPAARSPQPAARSPQPAARSPQPAARSPQPAARSPQPAARSPQLGPGRAAGLQGSGEQSAQGGGAYRLLQQVIAGTLDLLGDLFGAIGGDHDARHGILETL